MFFFPKALFLLFLTCILFSFSEFISAHAFFSEFYKERLGNAVRHNNVEDVKYLLELGANPDDIDVVDMAVELNHIEVVKVLTQHSPSVGPRAIAHASHYGKFEMVKHLIEFGIKPSQGTLVCASEAGNSEIVELILKNRTDLTAEDYDEPLWLASEEGHTEVVELLLKNGADPKRNMNEAIVIASKLGNIEVVKHLLKYGADPNARDDYVIIAACENGHTEVVKLLIDHGADPKARQSQTIVTASSRGHLEVAKLLLEHGADPRTRESLSIKLAAIDGHLEVVKLLLKYGADPNEIDDWRFTSDYPSLIHILEDHKHVSKHFAPHLSKNVLTLSKEPSWRSLVPGIRSFSISLNLIKEVLLSDSIHPFMFEKLCTAAIEVKMGFVGLSDTKVKVKGITNCKDLCCIDLEISWPSDLTELLRKNLTIEGQVIVANGYIGIVPVQVGDIPGLPEYSISHPSIRNTSAFFIGESLNVNLEIDKFKASYLDIVDGNQFKLQMNNQTFTESFNMSNTELCLNVAAKSLFDLKEKFQPFLIFTIAEIEYRINLQKSLEKPYSIHEPKSFFELPNSVFNLNEGIQVIWIKTTPYLELVKRNISLQVTRSGSSTPLLQQRVSQSGFVSFSSLSSLLDVNTANPFGSYVVKLSDMNGKIGFGEVATRNFDIVRPTVDRIGFNQSGSDNSTLKVFWESPVCSALSNITKLNGILKANLTVTMQNESIYSVDLESYCILEHEFQIQFGNLSLNTTILELNVTLFDMTRNLLLATGNGTVILPSESKQEAESSQETNETDQPNLPLIIGGVVLGVLVIAGVVVVLFIIRKRRMAMLASNGKMDSFSVQSNSIFSVTNANRKMYSF